jgi:hypothetical protein
MVLAPVRLKLIQPAGSVPPQSIPEELDWIVPTAFTSPVPSTAIALQAVGSSASIENGKLRS